MFKRGLKITGVILAVLILGGLAGTISERFVMPWLASKDSLKRFKIFQLANERVTVINKTEQVTVKEDFSVAKTTQNVLPSVVSIVSYQEEEQKNALNIKSSQDIQNYVKTGLVITSDGLIMSVWDPAQTQLKENVKYKVLASDGKEFDASLKAVDPYSNLAFYKVDATNLSAAVFGNSDELESGEKIIVAGNAGGEYQNNFSMGIIKEKDPTFTLINSELASSEKMEGAIITDVQIDAKNIGGPAIDFNGTVVGIANQIEKDGKKVGFIMPLSSLKESIDNVIRNSNIGRPYLGLYYLSINKEIALLNNLPVNQGALIYSFSGQQGLAIIKNSPAEVSGLKLGDIITEVGAEKVTLNQPLSRLISKQKLGNEIELTILRNKETSKIKVKLTENPQD